MLTYRINHELVPIFQAAQGQGSEFMTYNIVLSQDATDVTLVNAAFELKYQGNFNLTHDELHIILKRKNLEICKHSSFSVNVVIVFLIKFGVPTF